MLAHNVVNGDSSNTVVLVHGFTQTSATWGDIARSISSLSRVVSIDLPGHGLSSNVSASLCDSGDLVVDVGGTATYVGYSLGARVVLHSALQHPNSVTKLVLCGANPGIVDPIERNQRKVEDDALASHIEVVGVQKFIDEWLTTPLFAGLTTANNDRASRVTNSAHGLANSLRTVGVGLQENLWPKLANLNMPVLIITGADDKKFTEIGSKMREAIGTHASHVVVPHCGHAVPLEQPQIFAELVSAFIAQA